ncbi:hypothetical protein ACRCD8_09880 [Aliarcobacter sp. ERUVET-8]|uniref:hypothetical protein n=1 Tax=Aliarcobacter sp. ERUVET-8 TaxID=3429684 RepID=UPI003D6A718B
MGYDFIYFDIIVINELEYIKSKSFVGLSIESILETIKLASIDILNVMIDDLNSQGTTDSSEMSCYLGLINKFKARKAKTINNL